MNSVTDPAILNEFQRLSSIHEADKDEFFKYYNYLCRTQGVDAIYSDEQYQVLNEKQAQSYRAVSEFREKYFSGWPQGEIDEEDLKNMNPSTRKDYINKFLFQIKTKVKISMEINGNNVIAELTANDLLNLCNSRTDPFADIMNTMLDEHVLSIVPEEKKFEYRVANREIR